jgi:hypothetical protein
MIGVAYPRAALRLDRVGKLLLLGPGIGVLAGCGAAPSLTVVGSYFPAWLACGVIGVVAAVVARIVFVATGLVDMLPLQLYVCAAIGIFAACLIWLVWVG